MNQYLFSHHLHKYFAFDWCEIFSKHYIPPPHQVMDVTEGEPNLYVAKSPNKYPKYYSLAWSSYNWGGEDLVISSWDPEFTVGTYYIGVHAYCGEDVKTNNSGEFRQRPL